MSTVKTSVHASQGNLPTQKADNSSKSNLKSSDVKKRSNVEKKQATIDKVRTKKEIDLLMKAITTYKGDVLSNHKAFKTQFSNLGEILKIAKNKEQSILLQFSDLQLELFLKADKNKVLYKAIKESLPLNKKGEISIFKLRQVLQKLVKSQVIKTL